MLPLLSAINRMISALSATLNVIFNKTNRILWGFIASILIVFN